MFDPNETLPILNPELIKLSYTGVAIIICITAPITQTCINPARDFAPRLFAFIMGWGKIAIPGPRGGFFHVYILSPLIGSVIGAGIYELAIRRGLPPEEGS